MRFHLRSFTSLHMEAIQFSINNDIPLRDIHLRSGQDLTIMVLLVPLPDHLVETSRTVHHLQQEGQDLLTKVKENLQLTRQQEDRDFIMVTKALLDLMKMVTDLLNLDHPVCQDSASKISMDRLDSTNIATVFL